MEKIAPGKFMVTLSGEADPRLVVLTLGLRADVYRLITRKRIEYQQLSAKGMITETTKSRLGDLTAEIEAAEKADSSNVELISDLRKKLAYAYREALEELERSRDALATTLAMGLIDMTEKVFVDICALLLSKRDEKGVVLERLDPDELLHSETFLDDQDELLELIDAAVEYITDAVKKISKIGQMVAKEMV